MCLAIPGQIVEIADTAPDLAVVDVLGVRRKVDVRLLLEEQLVRGDWVLLHVGFAMTKISEKDALDQIRLLSALGEDEAAIEEVHGYGLGEQGSGKSS